MHTHIHIYIYTYVCIDHNLLKGIYDWPCDMGTEVEGIPGAGRQRGRLPEWTTGFLATASMGG